MWKLYFYGEPATDELCSLKDLATHVSVCALPDDLSWFQVADIEWEAVNSGYINRQFTGPGEPPALRLVHG